MSRLWTPADLATPPFAWFDAASPDTLTTSGSTVASWASRTGSIVLANTTDAKPVLLPGGLNSMAAIDFSVGRLFNRSIVIPAGSTISVFAVGKILSAKANDYFRGVCFVTGSSNDAFGGKTPIISLPNANAAAGQRTVGYDVFNQSSVNVTTDAFHVLEGYATSTTTRVAAADGTLGTVIGSGAPTYASDLTSMVVSGSGNGDGNYWPGYFCEIVVVLGVLPAASVAYIEGYLAWRWGLQANLPSSHAYAAAPPAVTEGGPSFGAASGAIALSGQTAQLLRGHTLPVAGAALGLAGGPARLDADRRVVGGGGELGLIGMDAGLRQRRVLASQGGTMALAGTPVQLLHGYSLPALGSPFLSYGASAALRATYRLAAQPGGLQLDGLPIALDLRSRSVLGASWGDFTLSGQPLGLRLRRRMAAEAAVFPVAGSAATFGQMRALTIFAAAGTFALSGINARPLRAARFWADRAHFASGTGAATLRMTRRLAAQPGAHLLTAGAVTLTIAGGEPVAVIPGPCWARAVTSRRFAGRAVRRNFHLSSTGCTRMITFPGKYAHEVRHASIDFAPDLADGETLTGMPQLVVNGTVVADGERIDGSKVLFTISGGTAVGRSVQRVAVYVQTSNGQTLGETALVTLLG